MADKETVKVNPIDLFRAVCSKIANGRSEHELYLSEDYHHWNLIVKRLETLNSQTTSVVGFEFYPKINPVEIPASEQDSPGKETLQIALMNSLRAVLSLNRTFVVKEWRQRLRRTYEMQRYVSAIDEAILAIEQAIEFVEASNE